MPRPSPVVVLGWAVLIGWLLFLRPAFLGGPASYTMVGGHSMEPTLWTGDLAVGLRQDSYSVGDVVVYVTSDGNIIHRIRAGSAEEGFVMRGDNKTDDPWNPTPDQILGKMWFFIPGAGRWLAYLRQPLPLAATITLLALLSLIGGKKARRRWRGGRRMAHGNSESGSGYTLGPAWAVAALGAFVVLGLAFAAGAGLAFRQPVQRTEQVELVRRGS